MIKKVLLFASLMGVFALLVGESQVLAYIKWEIVLSPDTTRSWESFVVYPSYTMYDSQDSIYKMWYSSRGPNSGYGSYAANGINYAISADAVNWENRQLIEGYSSPTYYQVSAPWIVKAGDVYKIWHRHYFESCVEWSAYIMYCESPDGVDWGPETYNFGCPGRTWETYMPGNVIGSILQKGDSTFLYYDAAYSYPYLGGIGRAVSVDSRRTWIDSTRTMIISPDSVKLCDSLFNAVGDPNVTLREDGTYKMYFHAHGLAGVPYPLSYFIHYIYEGVSEDGLYWAPDSIKPFLAPYMLGGGITGVRWPFYFKDRDGKEYLYFAFVDTTYIPTYVPEPPDYGVRIGRVLLSNIVNGDCNCDSSVDVGDVVCLINYLYKSGPAPCVCMEADVTGDGYIDIGDVVYLINYLYKNGPKPLIGCASNCSKVVASPSGRPSESFSGNSANIRKNAETAKIALSETKGSRENEIKISILAHFNAEIAGVQLEITYDPKQITLLEPSLTERTEGLQLYSSTKDGVQKIGILDMSGQNYVLPGEGPLVTLRANGNDLSSLVIKEAILVGKDANKIPVEIVKSISTTENHSVPQEFSLTQNYPNPFNPVTSIQFSVASGQSTVPTTIKIYNIRGQLVRTLVDELKMTGSYEVIWDGKDGQENEVASGVYFYKLKAGDYNETKKMILMK